MSEPAAARVGLRQAPAGDSGRRLVFALGVLSLAGWAGLAAAGDLAPRIPLFLALHTVLFATYALLLVRTGAGARLDRASLRLALGFAIVFRLAALAAPPSLSDDLYRYLWDGRVLASGVNPYRHPPAAAELVTLRDGHHAAINHPELPTIYPPAAQVVFAGVATVWPAPIGIKAAMAVMDLLALAALALLLRALGLPAGRLVVQAWCPLVILEFAGMGHVDAIGIALLTGALAALAAARHRLALAALGAAALAKLFPLLLVPAFLARTPRRAWFVLPLVLAAGVLPFAAHGVDPTGSLGTFAARWRGNDVAFAGLVALTGSPDTAKGLALLLLGGVLAACRLRRASLESTALAAMTAALLLSPVLHPWYLTWIVPLLAVRPEPALVAWTGSIALAYLAVSRELAVGVYEVRPWVRGLEFAIPLAIGVLSRAGPSPPSPRPRPARPDRGARDPGARSGAHGAPRGPRCRGNRRGRGGGKARSRRSRWRARR